MSVSYTNTTVTGYNATPPVDDGTVSEANRVTWAKIKTKITDPLKTAIESIDSNVDTSFSNADGLPSQTGNADKFLQTNGSVASWATPDSVLGVVELYLAADDSIAGGGVEELTMTATTGGDPDTLWATNQATAPTGTAFVIVENSFMAANNTDGLTPSVTINGTHVQDFSAAESGTNANTGPLNNVIRKRISATDTVKIFCHNIYTGGAGTLLGDASEQENQSHHHIHELIMAKFITELAKPGNMDVDVFRRFVTDVYGNNVYPGMYRLDKNGPNDRYVFWWDDSTGVKPTSAEAVAAFQTWKAQPGNDDTSLKVERAKDYAITTALRRELFKAWGPGIKAALGANPTQQEIEAAVDAEVAAWVQKVTNLP